MIFPTIGKYNETILSKNGLCLNKLNEASFIPVRTVPFKFFSFGSGANAVVFKIKNGERYFGLRCFLNDNANRIERSRIISRYLKGVSANWKVDYEFIDDEICINGIFYPTILMTWFSGKDLNTWVAENINNFQNLTRLQDELMKILLDLESNNIGHGDIQCGNLLIEGNGSNINLKLIDYDGMYVPSLSHLNSIENGRAEFQHPKRREVHFRSTIDRFPILVIITALEILKYDKSFWQSPLQNGFNSLDNMLFTSGDFKNLNSSKLVQRARGLNERSINYYLDQLESALNVDVLNVEIPKLYSGNVVINSGMSPVFDTIKITSNVPATVICGMIALGQTPLELEKEKYLNKDLILTNGKGGLKKVSYSYSDSNLNVVF